MQEVVYISDAGHVLTFGTGPPYILGHIDGAGELSATLDLSRGVGMDGSTDFGSVLSERELTLTCTLDARAQGRTALYRLRETLARTLNPKLGGMLIYQNDYGRWRIRARPQKLPVYGTRTTDTLPFIVYFTAPRPYWEDVNASSFVMGASTGGLRFPLRLGTRFSGSYNYRDIDNTGHTDAPVTVEFMGTAVKPSLINVTTGQRITVERALEAGDALLIGTEIRRNFVQIRRASGQIEDATSWLSPDSTFWQLVPGVNRVTYATEQDDRRNRVTVSFRNLYVGV